MREDQEAARRPKEGLAGDSAAPPAYKAQEPMVVPSSVEAPPQPSIDVPTAPTPVTQPAGDGAAAAR